MASASSASRAAAAPIGGLVADTRPSQTSYKRFPDQAVLSLLLDLVQSELATCTLPVDDATSVRFAAMKATVPARLAPILSQIGVAGSTGIVSGFDQLVRAMWKIFRATPLASVQALSVTWDTLTTVFEAACAASEKAKVALCRGGRMVTAALIGILVPSVALPAGLPALLEWWSDEVCTKRWGIADTWDFCVSEEGVHMGPLHAIAFSGVVGLVPLAIRRGCPVNGDFEGPCYCCPIALALRKGHMDVVEALMAHEPDLMRPYKNGWPLVLRLIVHCTGRGAFLAGLLRTHPELLRVSGAVKDSPRATPLEAAIFSRDAALVDLVLAAGAPIEYACELLPAPDRRFVVAPSIWWALNSGNKDIIELVITKGKALEGWVEKYSKDALSAISEGLVKVAISAYPPNPRYDGDAEDLLAQNPQAMECLELALASGIVCSWNYDNASTLLDYLYPVDKDGYYQGCVLEEKHALAVLKRFHAAGFEVAHWSARHDVVGTTGTCGLAFDAISAGQPEVLDWTFGTLRANVEGSKDDDETPLFFSLAEQQAACSILLLEKYKAKAAYPEKPLLEQPVMAFLGNVDDYSDAEAKRVLRALLTAEPSLFDLECFGEASVTAAERSHNHSEEAPYICWNPLFQLTRFQKLETLEFLLTKSPAGVAAMANRRVLAFVPGGLGRDYITAAQFAALMGYWESLAMLLRHTDARVTDIFGAGNSIASLVHTPGGPAGGAPRTLVAAVKLRVKKEKEGSASRPSAAAPASAATTAPSNAFEDPSVKPLTEREAKKKAKKRAAKKKAKAKKRAAANAGAGGAGPAHDDDTDSDDSSSDDAEEEPDDNLVDSRNAPSLDLMLEQMGLKEDSEAGGSGAEPRSGASKKT